MDKAERSRDMWGSKLWVQKTSAQPCELENYKFLPVAERESFLPEFELQVSTEFRRIRIPQRVDLEYHYYVSVSPPTLNIRHYMMFSVPLFPPCELHYAAASLALSKLWRPFQWSLKVNVMPRASPSTLPRVISRRVAEFQLRQ